MWILSASRLTAPQRLRIKLSNHAQIEKDALTTDKVKEHRVPKSDKEIVDLKLSFKRRAHVNVTRKNKVQWTQSRDG